MDLRSYTVYNVDSAALLILLLLFRMVLRVLRSRLAAHSVSRLYYQMQFTWIFFEAKHERIGPCAYRVYRLHQQIVSRYLHLSHRPFLSVLLRWKFARGTSAERVNFETHSIHKYQNCQGVRQRH